MRWLRGNSTAYRLATVLVLAVLGAPAQADELAFAGAGANQCALINSSAMPGRGPKQNATSMQIFSWIQGYMSGFGAVREVVGI
jgi:hypothetical protein